jgi:hypothetical protein
MAMQRAADQILRPHRRYSRAYIDDIATHSGGWTQHMRHLDAVLTDIGDSGITLRLAKATFAKPMVTFVGHEVGSGIRRPLFDKLLAIRAIPPPTTKRQLRGFLGACNFYRDFSPRYSELTSVLTDLTKAGVKNTFTLTDFQLKAFQAVKDELCR